MPINGRNGSSLPSPPPEPPPHPKMPSTVIIIPSIAERKVFPFCRLIDGRAKIPYFGLTYGHLSFSSR
jgi:hypothetical protein